MNNEVLRRRLVGALVLFALAFGLASLLPDAHKPDRPNHSQVVTYDLSTGLPVDENNSAAPETPVQAPLPTQPRTAVQLQESPVLSTGESWYVQVGSFENQANARAVLAKLDQIGFPTTIQSIQMGKNLWFRVRVGPYTDEIKTKEVLGDIRRRGYAGAKLVHLDATADAQ